MLRYSTLCLLTLFAASCGDDELQDRSSLKDDRCEPADDDRSGDCADDDDDSAADDAGADAADDDSNNADDDAVDDDVVDDDAGAGADDSVDDTTVDDTTDDTLDEPLYTSICSEPATGRPTAYFNVPKAEGWKLGDYFQLPFPNVIHSQDGKIDLTGFPAPTATFGKILGELDGSVGFGNYPTVIFRFSGPIDFDSTTDRVHFFDITNPMDPKRQSRTYRYSSSAGKYVCQNSLSVRPTLGRVLEPNRTFAVWIEAGVLGNNGLSAARSPQFEQVIGDAAPADPLLADAHAKYAPLREYLAAQGIAPEDVLSATVFDSSDPRAPMTDLVDSVRSQPVPTASGWTKCAAGVASPCPDATGGRACGDGADSFDEYHALVELPIFQQGEAPYFSAGGEISSELTRSEQVCVSLTVPKTTAPPNGFPLVVYGHGAGGSFRSSVSQSKAGNLTAAPLPDGNTVAFAVLGYDLVQHGPRRGEGTNSGFDPELLLFNFLNAPGTVGSGLQGAADVLSLARFAQTLELPAAVTGAEAVQFDASQLLFWGQSQGSMQGALVLPYADEYAGAVLGGLGGGFLHSLLLRKEPVSIGAFVTAGVADPGSGDDLVFNGDFHPALSILQHMVDPVDPLHHALKLVSDPAGAPLHVFQPYGINDSASPGLTMQAFALAAGLAVVEPHASADPPDDIGTPNPQFPLAGNYQRDGSAWTAGVREYGPNPPTNSEGHFVSSHTANPDILTFLAMVAAGQVPQIGQ